MNRGKRKFEVPNEGAEARKKNRGSGASLDNSMDILAPLMPSAGYPEVEKAKTEEVARLKEIFPDLSSNYLKVQALVFCKSHFVDRFRKSCQWEGVLRQQWSFCCCSQVTGEGMKASMRSMMPASLSSVQMMSRQL